MSSREQTNLLRGLNQLRHAANNLGNAASHKPYSNANLLSVSHTLLTLANCIQFGRPYAHLTADLLHELAADFDTRQ